ncbi:hypothetical protein MKK67_12065 [Methylobacterium sp. J-072]|uniref:hypothetical protein n=1 Tax=Methylobacterium sp. J-072 TaxID=2836651 RepID=UPI001FBADBFB|nr:hypothetical protein [Methylobacterium sp. J-072]MCJ2093219.1 hypothetical protein [Methylobacterium sp. J-072]
MNVREGFHRVGSVFAVITAFAVALLFAMFRTDLNERGILFFAAMAVILPVLAYGTTASVGWVLSGFQDRT